ncbi:hypothetical protein BHM03_00028847, partial [Ensete ventricosum]
FLIPVTGTCVCRDDLESYTSDYTIQVLVGYCTVYIFMQTFMIPGTIFMSLLAGALFGVMQGVALVVFAATAGASSCYFLSYLIGRPLVLLLWPDKLSFFQEQVKTCPFLNTGAMEHITKILLTSFVLFASNEFTVSTSINISSLISFQVAKRREKLLNYMLFLRVTPMLPNTFINVASPIVDVPYHIFFLATIIGLIPAAYVTVRVPFLLPL